jgi:DNA-binding NarL/FixJ family response regulator
MRAGVGGGKSRVLLAHPHEIVRAGLGSILLQRGESEIVGETSDGREAVSMARELSPDLAILGIAMRKLNGIEATRQILRAGPETRVIVIADDVDEIFVTQALRAGACSFLLKNSAAVELTLAQRAAREGTTYLSPGIGRVVMADYLNGGRPHHGSALSDLTPKQREVLQLIAEGSTNKEIASSLKISVKTAETHRAQIMKNLNLHSVAALTKYAVREGLSSLE